MMDIKIEGWTVTIHNENGDRLELRGEFEAEFFKEYENKQLSIANVVGRSEQLAAIFEKMNRHHITMLEIGDYDKLAKEMLSS